ncbi:MAG: signal recognition particle-docking protein FtsY, partial [Actinomycetes bacterium]
MGIFSKKNKEEKPVKTKSTFGTSLVNIFSRTTLDEQAWQEIEDTLIMADVGIKTTQEIVQELKNNPTLKGAHSAEEGKEVLRNQLIDFLATGDRSLNISASPSVLMMVGINGTGKTTTVGKLAHKLVKAGNKCVLGAADTFRAAASQQLQTWGQRSSVPVVTGVENSEPSAVAFNAVQEGLAVGAKVVIIDTAGRLHTKAGLMDELGKVKRVIEKHATVTETLLVIDATTGQNGLIQARVFTEAVEVTGIVLTKLDGSAKGGIVIAVQRELKVPV